MYPIEYSITRKPTTVTTISINAESGSTSVPTISEKPFGNEDAGATWIHVYRTSTYDPGPRISPTPMRTPRTIAVPESTTAIHPPHSSRGSLWPTSPTTTNETTNSSGTRNAQP